MATVTENGFTFKPARRVTYYGPPNKKGEVEMIIEWLAAYHPGHPDGENRVDWRGQVFVCKPESRGLKGPVDDEDFPQQGEGW